MARYIAVILMRSVLYWYVSVYMSVWVSVTHGILSSMSRIGLRAHAYIMVHASQLYHIRQILFEKSICLGNMDLLELWLPANL